MVNADNTTKEQTKLSESMRHFVVKSVLVRFQDTNLQAKGEFSKKIEL